MDKKKAENRLKRKAKEQVHEQLKEEDRLKWETKKAKLKKKEAETNFASYKRG